MVIIASGLEEVENVPETLEEFFQAYPRIGEANQALTAIPHVNTCEFRDQVLFIKQRQQATSDYRENPHVQWIGSHAAMTCHIVIMRHRITGVTSLGHFDNFCCWQLGEDSSAHRDGLDIMVEEISYLSNGNFDNIEVMIMQNILRTILEILNFFLQIKGDENKVTVVGGYTDARGDAAKNSLSLLQSLHEHWCYLNLVHFCVGKYNTQMEDGLNVAILKGIAVDLSAQEIFPAIFAWGQYEDFKTQLKQKIRGRRFIKDDYSTVDATHCITAHSTFKPKSLKNPARSIELVKQAHSSIGEKMTDAAFSAATEEFDQKLELLKKTEKTKSRGGEAAPMEESSSGIASWRLRLRPEPTNARNALELWGPSPSSREKAGTPASTAPTKRKKRKRRKGVQQ